MAVIEAKVTEEPQDFIFPISGVDYTMSFDLDDLCDGEKSSAEVWGVSGVNLLHIFIVPTLLMTVQNVFAMSLEKHHPEIPFNQRRELVNLKNVAAILAIQWSAYGTEVEKVWKDPGEPEKSWDLFFAFRLPGPKVISETHPRVELRPSSRWQARRHLARLKGHRFSKRATAISKRRSVS